MSEQEEINYEKRYFRVAAFLVKFLCIIIGGILLFFSQFVFIFFSIGMIPAVISSFIDRQYQLHSSATVTTFNLIGILPYLSKMWAASSSELSVRMISTDISTWVVIYGCALLGQVLFWILPPIIAKLYILKCKVEASLLVASKEQLCAEWNIKLEAKKAEPKKK